MTYKKVVNYTLAFAISSILSVSCYSAQNISSDMLPVALKVSHEQTSEDQQWQAYVNSQYSYDDAASLAEFWRQATPWDAKLKIGRLLLEDNEVAVQDALSNSTKPTPLTHHEEMEEQQWNAYAESVYTYDDAVLLAKFWEMDDELEAKYEIGRLLLEDNEVAIQDALSNSTAPTPLTQQEETVEQQWSAYAGSIYTYDDAVLLAEFWGKPDALEAKYKIGQLLLKGKQAEIDEILKSAK